MSEKKKGQRDPIHRVGHVIKLLKALTPADRRYAYEKSMEEIHETNRRLFAEELNPRDPNQVPRITAE